MKRDRIVTISAIATIAAATFAVIWLWGDGGSMDSGDSTDMDLAESEDFERGPNGGRMLRNGPYALEVTIFESGIPPEFRLYGYHNESALSPSAFSAEIELRRLGGQTDVFAFMPEREYLRGLGRVTEPHSFDVDVSSTYQNSEHRWSYESHEGRTSIPPRVAESQGIRVELAGGAVITESIELTGTIQTDPGRVSQVRARFPGVVTNVSKTVGDVVTRGESLGTVETNESLRSISIDAPIGGLIVNRNVQNGQVTGEDPLFVIADLSEVWVYLDVFGNDLGAVEIGQRARITTFGGAEIEGAIDWVSPLVAHGSQSIRARVTLPNPEEQLRPGQFVRAMVIGAEHVVPLAVKRSAIQTFRDFDVVYARVGDAYEVRMLGLGRSDTEWIEVLSGLREGELYVTENSYLIKADIEKSGATHDH